MRPAAAAHKPLSISRLKRSPGSIESTLVMKHPPGQDKPQNDALGSPYDPIINRHAKPSCAQEDERQTDLITGAWTASGKVYGYAQFMMI